MAVFLLPTFIRDLQREADANFAKRVITKVFDRTGGFRTDGDDHRFDGIADGWIRYVSRGSPAFRVMFIRRGEDVFLYRAGPHSVEDRLTAPSSIGQAIEVTDSTTAENLGVGETEPPREEEQLMGRLISSLRTPMLAPLVYGRRLIPHKEVTLISPFLSHSLLLRTARLGRLLDDLIEDGAKVNLITRPPQASDLAFFKDLEERGIDLWFHERLHAKLYLFSVDQQRVAYGRNYRDLIIIGSANLTESGFEASRDVGNEELCYELPVHHREELESYLAYLVLHAKDLTKLRVEIARANRRRR